MRVGMRCVVQFGAKRIYVGIIASLSPTLPLGVKTHKVKSLGYLPDDAPIISQEEIDSWLVSYNTPIEEILAFNPDGILSGRMPRKSMAVCPTFDQVNTSSKIGRAHV